MAGNVLCGCLTMTKAKTQIPEETGIGRGPDTRGFFGDRVEGWYTEV